MKGVGVGGGLRRSALLGKEGFGEEMSRPPAQKKHHEKILHEGKNEEALSRNDFRSKISRGS